MEAVALHGFKATEPDEMNFEKDSVLHVISMDEDPNWFKARQDKNVGLVPGNYLKMRAHHWYIPNCSRREAEERLSEKDPVNGKYIQPDGAFILRQSENNPGQFSISVKEDVYVLHFRVFTEEPSKYFIWNNKFSCVNDLIEHHRSHTIYGLKTLLLKDCQPSKMFGPAGRGFDSGSQPRGPSVPNAANTNPNNNNSINKAVVQSIKQPLPISNHMNQPLPMKQAEPSMLSNLTSTDRAGQVCIALFDFKPGFDEEMPFKRGDHIRILGEDDENWWMGEILMPNGAPRQPPIRGLFPANYVEIIGSSGNVPAALSSNATSKMAAFAK